MKQRFYEKKLIGVHCMKKILSIILALLIAMLSVVPAFAAQIKDDGKTPLIVVSGMNTFPLYKDKGTSTEKQVFLPSFDIQDIVLKGLYGAASAAFFRDWNKLGDVVFPLAYGLFEPVAFNPNGTPKYNVTTTTFPESIANYPDMTNGTNFERGLLHTACDKLGADHVYFFNYDWRDDPIKNAVDLNTMIEKAKSETGHSKVDIAACSMGGAQTMAYISEYGVDSIENCVFLSSIFEGVHISSDLMTNKIDVNKEAFLRYINSKSKSADGGKGTLIIMLEVLNCMGVLDPVLNLTNNGFDALSGRLANELMKEVFCTMPGIWATVRDDVYEQAKTDLLDKTLNAELIKKIDYFHYNVRLKSKALIESAMEKGVKVAFCSHYNSPLIPVFESAGQHGDSVLDTYATSGGAFSAPVGSTLPNGYVQQKYLEGKNYISPDKVIDASTCIFPELVWFFKGVGHVGCPYKSDYNEFVFWLLETKTQQTVWTDASHPQFMTTDDGGKTLYALTEAKSLNQNESSSQVSVFSSFSNMIKSLSKIKS